MTQGLNAKVLHATKWSSITEIIAKVLSPVTTMILARLLVPEMFGIMATITIVISFAELFTDAGFQKYLIQKEFKSKEDLTESANVAFLTNLFLAILLWGVIIVFRDSLSDLFGKNKLGTAISIACVSLPLGAFSSIQMALFTRDLDFKTLFKIRVISLVIPLLITIPFAIVFRNYWALIIGNIALKLGNAIYFTYKSTWKPKLEYSVILFKQMFSFTSWTVLESILIWLSNFVSIIIVSLKLDDYHIGLFQTSITLVVQIITITVSAITPVLFSTLSRMQNNDAEFKRLFLSFQSVIALVVIPLGIGLFSFRQFVTLLLLGDQWGEAANFIGLLGLSNAFVIVYSNICSEVFRAKGKPQLSLVLQFTFLVFFIPSMIFAVNYGFIALYITHSVLKFILIIVSLILMTYYFKISLFDMLKSTAVKIIVAGLMFVLSLLMRQISTSFYWNLLSIVVCVLFYFGVLFSIKEERTFLLKVKDLVRNAFIS
jgi:O-antigen/teichoic acid export membrane protein